MCLPVTRNFQPVLATREKGGPTIPTMSARLARVGRCVSRTTPAALLQPRFFPPPGAKGLKPALRMGRSRSRNVRELVQPPGGVWPIADRVRSLLRKLHQTLRAPAPVSARSRALAHEGAPALADLLGRPAVNLDTPELQRFLAGKRVLVTGAGGSIGSEICRQTMRFCPRRVILVERAENALFEIDRELRDQWVGADVRPCLADVCDERRMAEIFRDE